MYGSKKQTMLIKLHYPEDKKYKSINNREVFVNADKIRFMQRKNVAADESLTEIWFDSKDGIIVIETPAKINFRITHCLQDKTGRSLTLENFPPLYNTVDLFQNREFKDYLIETGFHRKRRIRLGTYL